MRKAGGFLFGTPPPKKKKSSGTMTWINSSLGQIYLIHNKQHIDLPIKNHRRL